jgi:hypothetical protein
MLRSSLGQAWIVFVHRDIYPMVTFTIRSADELDVLMWIRLGVRSRFYSTSACPLPPGRSLRSRLPLRLPRFKALDIRRTLPSPLHASSLRPPELRLAQRTHP